MLQYSPLLAWEQNWGMVQRQHSGLWIRLFWFESGCPSLNYGVHINADGRPFLSSKNRDDR